MTNCSKCSGLLVRDYGTEHATRSKPSYKCINCGLRLDMRVLINTSMTTEQQSALVDRPKGTPSHKPPVSLEW